MKKGKLLSTVALSLLLGAGVASAQGMSKEPPERAPAAQQKAPAEKVAPPIKADDHKSPQTTGQASPDSKPTGKASETTGQSPKSDAPDKTRAMDKDKSAAPTGKSDSTGKSDASSKSKQSTTEQSRSTTTGQGAAGSSAKLSTEQRTKITSIVKQHKVEPTQHESHPPESHGDNFQTFRGDEHAAFAVHIGNVAGITGEQQKR